MRAQYEVEDRGESEGVDVAAGLPRPARVDVAEVPGAGADGGADSSAQLPGPAARDGGGASRAPALPGEESHGLEVPPGDEAGLGGGRAGLTPGRLWAEVVTVSQGGVVVAGVTLETSHQPHLAGENKDQPAKDWACCHGKSVCCNLINYTVTSVQLHIECCLH